MYFSKGCSSWWRCIDLLSKCVITDLPRRSRRFSTPVSWKKPEWVTRDPLNNGLLNLYSVYIPVHRGYHLEQNQNGLQGIHWIMGCLYPNSGLSSQYYSWWIVFVTAQLCTQYNHNHITIIFRGFISQPMRVSTIDMSISIGGGILHLDSTK